MNRKNHFHLLKNNTRATEGDYFLISSWIRFSKQTFFANTPTCAREDAKNLPFKIVSMN